MNTTLSRLGAPVLAAFISPALLAANLNALDVAALPGDRVELRLAFDEPVAMPRGYTLDQPARIALDLPGVSSNLGTKNRELGVGNARSVTVVEAQGRTRLVVNLTSLMPYSTRVDGNNLFIVLGEGVSNSTPALASAAATPPVTKPASVKPMGAGKAIENIDFRRGEDGAGDVIISLSDPSINPTIEEQGGKIRVVFNKVQLPDSLRARLDVQDFATPVRFVESARLADAANIVIEPTGRYDYLAYQTDSKLTISVKPLTEDEADKRKADRFVYSGEKLSLNFQDIDVRSVLQLIADFTDLNLVASDTVNGNITLRLQNVPWDQALDLVLKTKGLDKRQVGNVLLVAPADEIAARERQELESQRQIAELAPLRREVVQVNYAKAADIARLFQSVTNSSASGEDRGSIAVDDRTNNIIAYQTQDRLDELRRIVAQLDIPVRQVMIEARIVEANVDYDKSLGVNWRGARVGDNNFVVGGVGGNRVGAGNNPATALGTFVDLGATGATTGIGIGFITDNTILDLQLSAMEKTGNGEIVSQPKVVTSDKETAKILKGAEVPYQEASSSGATSTSFKEAALSLEVTPQITPDNRIIMEVKVTKDEPDFSQAASTGGVPSIRKNEVNAKVLVADGETIVIGGVFSNTQSKSVDKVPFLGDLPFVGRVFRRDLVQDRKSELLVFITPRIMNNQAIQASR
ncbi:type IV pilus secretin PilQ [Stutzerimonas stutzeri]|uniref:type IV pilus secretin PilQ n=1 Tax=Stutzerimonas stutzeri TaxID=316 RepID=UPI0006AC7B52|nr:type IV pilus secretin PilQ [Stutzerimonas stutzeri]KOR08876.1 fimbrial protein [Stutzerimonas stutzeri]MDH0499277.1 type IV pilus secretin PilQ [Stutzerimonas stutzeri]RRW04321.1 type IV pilus secretin PilQ [Stutzerimonas stutzeri]WGG17341.1 type IV pilus secretin PilQ [Stutzerimonas stutzeri]WRQ03639.1 type IV pilus secretin PilQ [Stutzerimonas stutzeri]